MSSDFDINSILSAIDNDVVELPKIVVETPEEKDSDREEPTSDNMIMSWIRGETPMPGEIKSFTEDANNRLNWAILLNIVTQFRRVNRLLEFIDRAENKILSADVDTLTPVALLKLYDNASTKVNDLLELARKFSLQNKDLLKGSNLTEEQQLLVDSIKGLDKDEIKKLKDLISQI